MASHVHQPHAPRRALTRVSISAGFGLAAAVATARYLPGPPAALVGWDAASLTLLTMAWSLIASADAKETHARAGAEDPGRTLVYAIILATSSISLVSATVLVREAHHLSGWPARGMALLCLVTVALAWTATHTGFTLRYAHLYYREDREGVGGVDFPGDRPPTYFDFAYFAFTIGMCFQVSDACVSSHQIRRAVLLHSLMSFAYNTTILAFVLNLVFGVTTSEANPSP
ncbi:MAG TPA: DUF1345 domain-containing protein [Polyangiaceae bacterium]|nr:DUF1345 domain-containing protein [Polyangiaceae bacterium]